MSAVITAVATSVVSMGLSYVGSKKAEKSAKAQAEEEAKYEKLLTTEAVRRIGIEERTSYGETLAGYAGGGVLAQSPGLTQPDKAMGQSGSPLIVLQEQQREFAAERKITEEAGASRVSQSLQRGKATADAYRYSGYANVASSISNLVGGGQTAGWWG